MLRLAVIDANEKVNRKYAGLTGSVVSGWLNWEIKRAELETVEPRGADVIFLVFSGALDWQQNCRAYLRRYGIEPIAKKRRRSPYIIAGGPADAIPLTVLGMCDALTVGEAYNYVRLLLDGIKGEWGIDDIRAWTIDYPHSIEREQVEQIERDNERPWLLREPASKLASPDAYVDWGIPPIRSDDKVIRIIAEKGCHCKCTFCATTYRQSHRQNLDETQVLGLLRNLKGRGERVQLISNDPMALPYFRRLNVRLDSQSFTIMELADNANRAAIIRSGVGIARFGVEGISERIRRAFAKPIDNDHLLTLLSELHTNKINTHLFFIVGAPGENHQDWDEFREFYWNLAKTIRSGICRIKFTTFVNTPPAPLARFIPDMTYEKEMQNIRNWISANAASRHLVYIMGRRGPTHIGNVAEQMSISKEIAQELVMRPGTIDLAPDIEDARRLPWEIIDWPINTDMRHKIGNVYAKRMDVIGNEPELIQE